MMVWPFVLAILIVVIVALPGGDLTNWKEMWNWYVQWWRARPPRL